jgi:membrane protein
MIEHPQPSSESTASPESRRSLATLPMARHAESLLGNSGRGRVVLDLLDGSLESDVLRAASAMAFDLFLAMIPLLALAGWLFGRIMTTGNAVAAVSLLLDTTPAAVRALAENQLARFSPGAVAPVALLGSLWLGSSAATTCMGLLEARGQSRPRPWWRRRLLAMATVFAGIIVFGAGSAVALWSIGGPVVLLESVVSDRVANWTGYVLGLGVVHVLAVALLALFFRVAVHRPGIPRRVLPGALVASVLGALASLAFTFYASKIARFALYYGGLAAVAVTLVWLWLICLFVLIGAELNVVLEGNPPPRP